MADDVVERFRPTSGRITGTLAVVMVVAVVVIALLPGDQGVAPYVVWGALFAGVLTWASTLRPGLWATDDNLVMRNMLTTISIPLASIEEVVVRQVCAVRAGNKRYVSPVIGKTLRQVRPDRYDREGTTADTRSYQAFVEDRIVQLAEKARDRAGVTLLSDEQVALAAGVRRRWAWPEIAALVVTLAGFVAAIVVAS